MNFTLYTYGDTFMFYNVLNAVAMVFNSSMFNPSSGAGAFLLGGLVSLVFLLVQTIAHPSSSTFRPSNLLFLFLFFFAGVNVKSTVQIEDIFTGTVSSVSNVPIFLSAPAGIISAAANGLTTNIETAFNTPAPGSSFSSISLGTEGFENPLRLLMSLRCNSGSSLAEKNCPARSFPYVTRSLQLFLLYCAIPNPSFSQMGLETSTNIVGYLTTLPGLGGLTTYYSTTYPQGTGMDCSTAASTISSDVANMFSGANLTTVDHIVYQNLIGAETGETNPATWGMWKTSDVAYSFNSIMNGSSSQMAAQGSQNYMTNEIFMDAVDNTWKCSSSTGSINEFNTCIDGITQRDALEKMKVDDSAAGSIFARTMFPAMNLLLMLFYGFSPLVALVAMMRMGDGGGLKIIGSYFLFGAWTQSWTPVAAIINYYMQMLAGQAAWAAGQTANGLVIQNEHMFYDALALKIALGANMLAATPILTMALLSGSMFAMTGAVSAIAGKDKVDESLAAPSLAQGNAVTQVGAANRKPVGNDDRTDVLGLGAKPGMDTLNMQTGSLAEASVQHSASQVKQTAEQAAVEVGHAISTSSKTSDVVAHAARRGQEVRNSHSQSAKAMTSMVDRLGDSVGLSSAQKDQVLGAVSTAANGGMLGAELVGYAGGIIGAIGGGVPSGGIGAVPGAFAGYEVGKKIGETIFGGGKDADGKPHKGILSVSGSVTSQSDSSGTRGKDLKLAMDEQIGRERDYTATHQQSAFAGVTDTTTHSTGHESGTTDNKALKQAISATQTAATQYQAAVARKNSIGSGVSVNGEQLVANVIHDGNLQSAIRNDMTEMGAKGNATDKDGKWVDPVAHKRFEQQSQMAAAIQKQFGLTDDPTEARLAAWAVAGTRLDPDGDMAQALDQHFNGVTTSYGMSDEGRAIKGQVGAVGSSVADTVAGAVSPTAPHGSSGSGHGHGGHHKAAGTATPAHNDDLTPPEVPTAQGGDPAMPNAPTMTSDDRAATEADHKRLAAEAADRAKSEGQGKVAPTKFVSPMTGAMNLAERVSPNTVVPKDGNPFDSGK